MCKVSVIVPIYNKSLYLRECLNSLANQTLKDIEIICIDDKSTDNSLDIVNEYALNDNRIKIIKHNVNKGVSVARNNGIKNAKGEFIAFVDADDIVEPMFYEKLYNASEGFECVKGEIWDYDPVCNKCSINQVYDLNDKIKSTGNPIYFYYGFTSAIYKKEFIDKYNLHFPEGISYYEDPFFSIAVASKLKKLKVVDNVRYLYRNVDISLSHDIDKTKIDDLVNSIIGIISYIKRCDFDKDDKYILLNQVLSVLGAYINKGKLSNSKLKQIKEKYLSLFYNENNVCNTKISIIVPVYNGEKYLYKTLEYLTFQSLYEIEIICVDDNSTDNSLKILNEYASHDKRIKVIHCDINGGESKARNIGLREAKGEYIGFMDQDDRIDLLFYEKLYEVATKDDADIAKGNALDIHYNGKIYFSNSKQIDKNSLFFASHWWTGIFSKKLINENKIEFPEKISLGGDLKFLFDACKKANRVATDNSVYYYHLMHPDSGDSIKTSTNKIQSVLAIMEYILDEIENSNNAKINSEIYQFYYYSYIFHLCSRILKCNSLDGKLLCANFIFKCFDKCNCKHYILERMKTANSLLYYALNNNDKEFFISILYEDVLSNIFYYKKVHNKGKSIKCSIVTPYVSEECVRKYIINNKFLCEEEKLSFHPIDNRKENISLSIRYNNFLDSFDYSNETWFIFMHSDFEFLEYPSNVLKNLDKNMIYGPVGVKTYFSHGKVGFISKGKVYEQDSNNNIYDNYLRKYDNLIVDTLDCMCLIVHSSLVKEYNLRFDENLAFDLYVEDFCIKSKKLYNIDTNVVYFDCAHHSSVVSDLYYKDAYLKQLEYLNFKYLNDIYGSTVLPIGGNNLPQMTNQELMMFAIRYELKTGKKI